MNGYHLCIHLAVLMHFSPLTTLKKKGLENTVRNGGNAPFPTILFTLSRREIIILPTIKLLSANAFNLVMSEISSLAKE